MPKSWFTVQAAADDAPAQVAIRGFIGEWGVTDRDFIAQVEALGDVADLTVRINSRGGEVDHALSIFNFLRDHPARVTVRVDGVAMSSATIIAMAGDEIVMPANTVMMVHNPWVYAAGSAKQLRQAAENLETWESALRETYIARTGKSEDDIKALLDEDTYLTAAECVEHGFADRVEPVAKASAGAVAVALASALGIPAEVLARAQAEADATKSGTTNGGDPSAVPAAAMSPRFEIGARVRIVNPHDAAHAAGEIVLVSAEPVYGVTIDGMESMGMHRWYTDSEMEPEAEAESDASAAEKPPHEMAAAVASTFAAQINAIAVAHGLGEYVAAWLLDGAISTEAQARAAIAEAREVRDLCAYAGASDQAAGFIRARKPLADVRTALINARAEAADALHTDGHPRTNPSVQATNAARGWDDAFAKLKTVRSM